MSDFERSPTDSERAPTDLETVARQLSNIHQTLELIALLIAVLLLGTGSIGAIAGGCAIVLLVGNAVVRAFD